MVDPWGTEEYVSTASETVSMPVGHNSLYLYDLASKLTALPTAASSDGYYVIHQVNNRMTLEETSNTGGGGDGYDLPDAPTTDGEYVLKVSIEDGEPTYSWGTGGGILVLG